MLIFICRQMPFPGHPADKVHIIEQHDKSKVFVVVLHSFSLSDILCHWWTNKKVKSCFQLFSIRYLLKLTILWKIIQQVFKIRYTAKWFSIVKTTLYFSYLLGNSFSHRSTYCSSHEYTLCFTLTFYVS